MYLRLPIYNREFSPESKTPAKLLCFMEEKKCMYEFNFSIPVFKRSKSKLTRLQKHAQGKLCKCPSKQNSIEQDKTLHFRSAYSSGYLKSPAG